MSTEDNNVEGIDPRLAALAAKAPLRGGVTGNVPDGLFAAPEPQPSAAAEAALAFIHDQPPAATTPALQLVAHNEESVALAAVRVAKHDALLKIDIAIATATDPEVILKLKELKEHVREAKSPSEIAAVLASVSSATNAAVASTETPHQRVERLQVEIAKLEKEINDDVDVLYAKGYISKEDYDNRKRRKDKGEWTTEDEKKFLLETRKKAEHEGDMETVKKVDATIRKEDILEEKRKEFDEAKMHTARLAESGLTAREDLRLLNESKVASEVVGIKGNSLKSSSDETLAALLENSESLQEPKVAERAPTTRLATADATTKDLGELSIAATNFSLPKLDQKTERS